MLCICVYILRHMLLAGVVLLIRDKTTFENAMKNVCLRSLFRVGCWLEFFLYLWCMHGKIYCFKRKLYIWFSIEMNLNKNLIIYLLSLYFAYLGWKDSKLILKFFLKIFPWASTPNFIPYHFLKIAQHFSHSYIFHDFINLDSILFDFFHRLFNILHYHIRASTGGTHFNINLIMWK